MAADHPPGSRKWRARPFSFLHEADQQESMSVCVCAKVSLLLHDRLLSWLFTWFVLACIFSFSVHFSHAPSHHGAFISDLSLFFFALPQFFSPV